MSKLSVQKIRIFLFILALITASIACNLTDVDEAIAKVAVEECIPTSRDLYEGYAAPQLGETPKIPKYPEGALYAVCYLNGEVSSIRMSDGYRSDEENIIPAGSYTGASNFYSTLENDVDDSFSEPICKENIITVDVESDGTTKGELRSICHANAREGERSTHSEVTGIINGNLTDTQGQCIVSYTWRSYNDGPQCTPDTPCRDDTVNFDFLYNVNTSGDIMTFTPAGDVEDYYSFELTKQASLDESEQTTEVTDQGVSPDDDDLPEWVKNRQAYIDQFGRAVYVPDWLEWIKPKKKIIAKGVVIEPRGEVWVYSEAFNKWRGPVRSDWTLYTGDVVSTGPNASARVVFTNKQGKQDTISVGNRTLLTVPEIPGSGAKSDYPMIWSIYYGAIKIRHAILREPAVQVDHPFALIRTSNIVVGVRGTEFVVLHDAETQTSSIYLTSGELDYYNLAAAGPDDAILTADQKLVVQENGEEMILPLDETELEAVMAANNLDEAKVYDGEDNIDTDAVQNNISRLVIYSIICVVAFLGMGAVIAIFVKVLRKKAT